jgi:predicted transcriptional regulator YheO
MNVSELLNIYKPVCTLISRLFPEQIEVILHDLKTRKILYIENSYSNRVIGDDSLICIEELEKDSDDFDIIGPYSKTNSDGASLKSITLIIRNGLREPIALMCINFKIEQLLLAEKLLSSLVSISPTNSTKSKKSLFSNDWKEQVHVIVKQVLFEEKTTLVAARRPTKLIILKRIGEEGIFSIRGSTGYVGDILGISRANLYAILRQIRSKNN